MTVDMHGLRVETEDRLCGVFNVRTRPYIEFDLSLSLGTSMGLAMKHRDKYRILLNPNLMLIASEEEIRDTLVHEICHVYDSVVASRWGHGPTWKLLMRACGVEDPRACHSVQTAGFRSRVETVPVRCAECGGVTGVPLRYKERMLRGALGRRCHRCGSKNFVKI